MAVPLCANGRRSSVSTTRHALCYLAASIFYLLILGDAIKPADAQAYHFSKGWMPGRKRATSAVVPLVGGGGHDSIESGTGASAALIEAVRRAMFGGENKDSSPSTAAVCAIRSRVYRLVLDMIREGFERLDDTCELGITHGASSTAAAAGMDSRSNYLRQRVDAFEKSASED